jgi:hypothetical protein
MQIKLVAWRPRTGACMPRQVMTCWPDPKHRVARRFGSKHTPRPNLRSSDRGTYRSSCQLSSPSARGRYAKIKSTIQSRTQIGVSITGLKTRHFDDSAISAQTFVSTRSTTRRLGSGQQRTKIAYVHVHRHLLWDRQGLGYSANHCSVTRQGHQELDVTFVLIKIQGRVFLVSLFSWLISRFNITLHCFLPTKHAWMTHVCILFARNKSNATMGFALQWFC